MDRESTFENDQVVRLLRSEFIPVALDTWYQEKRSDVEGDLYRRVVFQKTGSTVNHTTQGIYVVSYDGFLIDHWDRRRGMSFLDFLRQIHETYVPHTKNPNIRVSADPPELSQRPSEESDPLFIRPVPRGALVLESYSKSYVRNSSSDRIDSGELSKATGTDRVWITEEEIRALSRGTVKDSLIWRLARFHLVDNTRGEPLTWLKGDVQEAQMSIKNGAIAGQFTLKTKNQKRSLSARLQGVLVYDDVGKLSRLDMVVLGVYESDELSAMAKPVGTFDLAIGFSIAKDPKSPFYSVPPWGTRDLNEYLKPRN